MKNFSTSWTLQETKWMHDSEYRAPSWICIGSGDGPNKVVCAYGTIRTTVLENVLPFRRNLIDVFTGSLIVNSSSLDRT